MSNKPKSKMAVSIEKYKIPLLIFFLGVLIMLFPGGGKKEDTMENDTPSLTQLLSCTKGVGECKVLLSDKGVLVVCEGADNARIRLEIIDALGSYTGFGSDKITILKMAEQA